MELNLVETRPEAYKCEYLLYDLRSFGSLNITVQSKHFSIFTLKT